MATTMFVRNNQSGPTVFDEDDFSIKWQGAGDASGEDILPVPAKLADSFAFHRALYLGVLTVVEAEPDVEEALEGHKAAWARQQNRRNGVTLGEMGQGLEEGTVPREPLKAQVGPGAIPQTIDTETGVITKRGEAKPEITKTTVVMGARGSYF